MIKGKYCRNLDEHLGAKLDCWKQTYGSKYWESRVAKQTKSILIKIIIDSSADASLGIAASLTNWKNGIKIKLFEFWD